MEQSTEARLAILEKAVLEIAQYIAEEHSSIDSSDEGVARCERVLAAAQAIVVK
jgi:hypothetical protein